MEWGKKNNNRYYQDDLRISSVQYSYKSLSKIHFRRNTYITPQNFSSDAKDIDVKNVCEAVKNVQEVSE